MDFYGEPKPYHWPQVSAVKGIWDLVGLPKDSFWWYKAWWAGDSLGEGGGGLKGIGIKFLSPKTR